MPVQQIYLSPSEVARRLGLSPKALRLYERHGLLAPVRSAKGWRAYGPEQLAALHRIMALKRLGLTLAQIAQLTTHHAIGLDAVLEVQEQLLARETTRLGKALAVVRSARRRLAGGETLSIDDLATLTRETSMTPDNAKAIFDPLIAKHFDANEIKALAGKPYDADQAVQAWNGLIAEAKELMARDDTASPRARDLARRWKAQLDQFTGGDPALAEKAKTVWTDAMRDPATAPQLPLDPALFAFVGRILAGAG